MANEPAPYPIDELHAAAPEAATHIDALHAELKSDRPDPKAIDDHVETLKSHNGVVSLLEKWYLDEKTQAFVAELNGLGL